MLSQQTQLACDLALLVALNVSFRIISFAPVLFLTYCIVIPESRELDGDLYTDADEFGADATVGEDTEVKALTAALEECWTLCNTLANLSSIHRERVFVSSGTPDAHEKAWKSCWKLCKRLYHSRNDISESHNVRTNLDLCRDFCQALFDVRQKKDEVADSILRVSFELNNQYVPPIPWRPLNLDLTKLQFIQRSRQSKPPRGFQRANIRLLYHIMSSIDEAA